MAVIVSGFSKLSKIDKIKWIEKELGTSSDQLFENFWLKDAKTQKVIDDFSENTISNFILPFGIAPNFLIDEKIYAVPMVIEESSVVAAASHAAKFWSKRGGFRTKIIGTTKLGHIHLDFDGESKELFDLFNAKKNSLLESIVPLEANMKRRGGGVLDLSLIDASFELKNYYKLEVKFETCDAMGANFINSILEKMAKELLGFSQELISGKLQVIMSILSNYTDECVVEAKVTASASELNDIVSGMTGVEFATRFVKAVEIASHDVTRAVTHNKGIMNGVDAVVIATGNDFRAIEACAHAYAARTGKYRSLSKATFDGENFEFILTLPLALGTIGGLTSLHPLSRKSLEILGNPSAKELMKIIASVGLAQNFGAVRSLVTTGIQKGHMKMHLLNILNQLEATEEEVQKTKEFFTDKVVSFSEVANFLQSIKFAQ